jgi:NAD(P)-dependent dehydrogenase (short-subunit alcohol dehydrogenase family)
MDFNGKVVVITGGGGGIGKAAAGRFLDEGASVVLAGTRAAVLEAARDELDPSGARVEIVAGQITRREQAQALIERAVERFGGVDVLVNATGIFRPVPFLEQTEEHFEEALGSILRPTFWTSQAVVAAMRERGGGAIVNVASIAGLVGLRNRAAYCASKGAVIALTRALAVDHVGEGIRVNAVCPGTVDSPWVRRLVEQSGESLADLTARQPLGRLGTPEEIADAVLYLATAEFATGTILTVDGGMTAA